MFDFQKLEVYQKSLQLNTNIIPLLKNREIDRITKDQLKRAALSIVLNISEGTSRFSSADRRRFYIISRGSTYECAAILEYLLRLGLIDKEIYDFLSDTLEQISKMLYAMIRKLE